MHFRILGMTATTKWLFQSFTVHRSNLFLAAAPPQTPLGELTALPQTLSWFKGDPTSKGKEDMDKREWKGTGGKRKGGERGRPLDPPLVNQLVVHKFACSRYMEPSLTRPNIRTNQWGRGLPFPMLQPLRFFSDDQICYTLKR